MLEREPHASWGEGEFAPAPGPTPLWNIMWNKTGRRVHSPWHSHPGVPKRREYSHRPSRSHGHEDVLPIQADSIRFGDRRVRLLTVNLNADESKPGSCAVRGKFRERPLRSRARTARSRRRVTTPRINNYLHMQNQNACVCYSLWANHDGRISATTALAHEEALRAFR